MRCLLQVLAGSFSSLWQRPWMDGEIPRASPWRLLSTPPHFSVFLQWDIGTKEDLPTLGRLVENQGTGEKKNSPGVTSPEVCLPCSKRLHSSACITRGERLGASVVEGQRPAGCGIGSSLESGQPIKALMGLMISKVPGGKLD